MDSIDGIGGNDSYMAQLKALQEKQRVERGDIGEKQTGQVTLGQDDFLSLLTEQLSHQDPFKPVDNQQMISQMASFATVNGIGEMNEHFSSLTSSMASNQALQASSLVGQEVLVNGDQGFKSQLGGLAFIAKLPQAFNDVIVRIESAQGELLKTFNLGPKNAGDARIEWDGKDDNGNMMPEGNYRLTASANVENEPTQLEVATFANVNSVLLGKGDGNVMLNIAGFTSPVRLSEVLEVGNSKEEQ